MSTEYKVSPISHLGKYLPLHICFDGKFCCIVGSYVSFLCTLNMLDQSLWFAKSMLKKKEEALGSANFLRKFHVIYRYTHIHMTEKIENNPALNSVLC